MSGPDEFRDRLERLRKAGEYPALTQPLLDGFSDDDLEHKIFHFIHKQKIGTQYEQTFEIVRGLSAGFRAVYATLRLQMEVDNGGFHQFFWNQDPGFAILAKQGFDLFGADQAARLMVKVINVRSLEQEEGTLQSFSESTQHTALGDFDQEFYALEEDIRILRIRYIRTHPEEFVGR